jgi:CheY-like chemotaxis protein
MEKQQFRNSVKEILNHISDPAHLENSNLLSILLTSEETGHPSHLQTLRARIREGINVLQPPEDTPPNASEWRCYRILTLRYLQLKEWHTIEEELGLSQRQVQRDLKKGFDALVTILWDRYIKRSTEKPVNDEFSPATTEKSDHELIEDELKNWEICFDLYNLRHIIDQARQLCESLLRTSLQDRINYIDVDPNLAIKVDQILTRQGFYKLLTMVGHDPEAIQLNLQARHISDHFVELTFRFTHSVELETKNMDLARLFFTIQGVNQTFESKSDETVVSVILPLGAQNCCLVIDDVESVRRLIERMLGSYAIQVFGADNFQDALELAQLMKPAFILLDILMPRMDGWQMIKSLKNNPATKDIPIIISSVLFEPELSKAEGAVAYIRKPINRLELIETLQSLDLLQSS